VDDAKVIVGDERGCAATLAGSILEDDRAGLGDGNRGEGDDAVETVEG